MASYIDAIPTKSLEILLECSVCLETLNDPRTLTCFHSFCKGCLENFVQVRRENNKNPEIEVNTFECPVCRSEFTLNPGEGIEGIGANYFIRNMLDVMAVENRVKGIPCRHCKKASAGRCVNCEIFMCEGCIQGHNNYLANQNHSVLSMDELSKPENRSKIRGKPRCMEHDDEILKFFCETCEELICRDCKDDNHAEHQSSPLKKAAEQKTEELKGWCATLTDEFNKSNEALQAMNNVVQVLDDNVQGAKKKIRQRKDEILAAVGQILDEKEKSLTKTIDTMFQHKNEALSEQLGIAQVYANQVKSSIDVCKSLLENGDVVELVSSHALVGRNIEKVTTEHLESWNPVNDGSIGFNQCSTNDFQMEIQQLSERLGEIKGKSSNKDCSICQSPMTNPKVLTMCGHSFCAPCIDKAFTYKNTCPICQEVYGITEGDQPDITIVMAPSCADNNGVKDSERSGSSSSVVYDTQPYLATYIHNIHNEDLKKIQQHHNVAITWASDGTKVQITAGNNQQHFKLACEEFIEMYKYLYQSVTKVSFDVKNEDKRFGKGTSLENAVCSVPNIVPGLVLEKAVDGRTYTLWGTNTSLANGQEWIRRQLGIPSGLKTRSQSSNALTHETANKLKVVVYEGDITRENTDIIVNACNEHLDHGGGVSFAIAKAAGRSLQQESDNYVEKHGALSTGDVAVTGSGYLKCKKVLHAVGPQWKKHGKDKSIKLLKKIFSEIYKIAFNLNAKSGRLCQDNICLRG